MVEVVLWNFLKYTMKLIQCNLLFFCLDAKWFFAFSGLHCLCKGTSPANTEAYSFQLPQMYAFQLPFVLWWLIFACSVLNDGEYLVPGKLSYHSLEFTTKLTAVREKYMQTTSLVPSSPMFLVSAWEESPIKDVVFIFKEAHGSQMTGLPVLGTLNLLLCHTCMASV